MIIGIFKQIQNLALSLFKITYEKRTSNILTENFKFAN